MASSWQDTLSQSVATHREATKRERALVLLHMAVYSRRVPRRAMTWLADAAHDTFFVLVVVVTIYFFAQIFSLSTWHSSSCWQCCSSQACWDVSTTHLFLSLSSFPWKEMEQTGTSNYTIRNLWTAPQIHLDSCKIS